MINTVGLTLALSQPKLKDLRDLLVFFKLPHVVTDTMLKKVKPNRKRNIGGEPTIDNYAALQNVYRLFDAVLTKGCLLCDNGSLTFSREVSCTIIRSFRVKTSQIDPEGEAAFAFYTRVNSEEGEKLEFRGPNNVIVGYEGKVSSSMCCLLSYASTLERARREQNAVAGAGGVTVDCFVRICGNYVPTEEEEEVTCSHSAEFDCKIRREEWASDWKGGERVFFTQCLSRPARIFVLL